MAALLPYPFLFRIAYRCPYIKAMPQTGSDDLVDLPEACRIERLLANEGQRDFADVRLAWNEKGIGLQVQVKGKSEPPQADAARPRTSDGVSLWLDMRDARTSHRASRYCHQFHFLPTGGGSEGDEPVFVQSAIHRALQDAPFAPRNDVLFRSARVKNGYRIEAFLPASALTGFDPDQNRRLGIYYAIRDTELGEQVLSVGAEFPYWEDPSLWSALDLVR
jgi:hypothetical protein